MVLYSCCVQKIKIKKWRIPSGFWTRWRFLPETWKTASACCMTGKKRERFCPNHTIRRAARRGWSSGSSSTERTTLKNHRKSQKPLERSDETVLRTADRRKYYLPTVTSRTRRATNSSLVRRKPLLGVLAAFKDIVDESYRARWTEWKKWKNLKIYRK